MPAQDYDNCAIYPNYAIYLLSAVLMQQGFTCEIFDISVDDPNFKKNLEAEVGKFDCVCFSSNSLQWTNTKIAVEQIRREYADIPIVIGGIHASFHDTQILQETSVNYCIRGEGEKTLPELMGWMKKGRGDVSKIAGLSYKKDGKIIRNEDAKPLTETELEHLPFPRIEQMFDKGFPIPVMESSRGYPFFSPSYSIPYQKIWRAISPMGIIERIHRLASSSNCVYLVDDYFTASEKRIYDFAKLYAKKGLKIKFCYRSRCSDLLEESLIENLKLFTEKIILNCDCGYDDGLRRIKKGFTTKVIEESAKMLEKYDLAERSEYFFMLGFPWETKNEIMKTVAFSNNLKSKYGVNIKFEKFKTLPSFVPMT